MKRRISLAIGVIVAAASVTTAGAAVKEVVSWRGEGLSPWNRVSQARDLACGASGVSFITAGPDSQLYCE